MCRVERKAGEGSKTRDVLLVTVLSTLRNCDVFVDECVGARVSAMLICFAYVLMRTVARGFCNECGSSSKENKKGGGLSDAFARRFLMCWGHL